MGNVMVGREADGAYVRNRCSGMALVVRIDGCETAERLSPGSAIETESVGKC